MKSVLVDQLPKAVRDDLHRLGLAIRDGRMAKEMTQAALAARLQISPTTVRAAEQGDPRVAAGILVSILWALGVGPIANVVIPHRPEWERSKRLAHRVRPKALDDF